MVSTHIVSNYQYFANSPIIQFRNGYFLEFVTHGVTKISDSCYSSDSYQINMIITTMIRYEITSEIVLRILELSLVSVQYQCLLTIFSYFKWSSKLNETQIQEAIALKICDHEKWTAKIIAPPYLHQYMQRNL